jgi:type II secretory pathway pseudopilin PulG
MKMKDRASLLRRKTRRTKQAEGFTLVESLISGIIVASVMTGVGRMGVSSMATSRNQSSRNSIEAAINNHIQLVQMHDSYLTAESIQSESGLNTNLNIACQNPSAFLMNHLQNVATTDTSLSPQIAMDWNSEDPNLLILTYNFEAPESSITKEQRIVDINPNFSSQCYSLQ